MSPQPDTLHDRITALADEWEREATRWRNPANPTHRRTSRSDPRRDGRPDLADVYDFQASALRAVLAETTTAQPEAGAVERAARALDPGAFDPKSWCSPHFGQTPETARSERQEYARDQARAALAAAQPVQPVGIASEAGHLCTMCGITHSRAAQPVEPEANEQAAHDRISALVDLHSAARQADAVLAAGFRRSRPEATHTVTAEQVANVLRDAMDEALGVTVADTPTQAGDDA